MNPEADPAPVDAGRRSPWLSRIARQAGPIGLGTLIVALAAQVAVPIPLNPVPMTLQPLAVLVVGGVLGAAGGVSALVVASLAFAKAHRLTPLARVTGYTTGGGEPRDLFFAPVLAVRSLMEKTGTRIGDYDLIEANEAFAVQALADGRELGWDWDRVNVHGGAVALGHPIGASGARVLTTLLYALRDRGGRSGLATLCLGGGNAVALSVELI